MIIAPHVNATTTEVCRLALTETQTISDVMEDADTGVFLPEARFYFDFGTGLSEKNRVNARPSALPDGRLRYEAELPKDCIAVRFDPVELRGCILRTMTVEIDG